MKEAFSKKVLTVWVIIAVVLCGISFYAGDKHGQSASQTIADAGRGNFQGGQGGAGGNRRFGGNANGEVLSKDASTMTVKMRDGSTRIVLYSTTTQVFKSTASTPDDVTVGETVSVMGTANSDGSVTAQSIQIRPAAPTKIN